MLLLLLFLSLLFQHSSSASIIVDGISPWPNPTVHIGDSVIFKHKYGYKLYIFKNERAFSLCNFSLSSLLTNSISNYFTWYPSRPGFYYFTFSNAASPNSCTNKYSQKLSVKVSVPPPPPVASPVQAPVSGGGVSSSPAYPWPSQPRDSVLSPVPAPAPGGGANSPMKMPTGEKGENMPFINSNPAVPLPTDEVDSATIRPLSTSGHRQQVAVGFVGAHLTLFCGILMMLLVM